MYFAIEYFGKQKDRKRVNCLIKGTEVCRLNSKVLMAGSHWGQPTKLWIIFLFFCLTYLLLWVSEPKSHAQMNSFVSCASACPLKEIKWEIILYHSDQKPVNKMRTRPNYLFQTHVHSFSLRSLFCRFKQRFTKATQMPGNIKKMMRILLLPVLWSDW